MFDVFFAKDLYWSVFIINRAIFVKHAPQCFLKDGKIYTEKIRSFFEKGKAKLP